MVQWEPSASLVIVTDATNGGRLLPWSLTDFPSHGPFQKCLHSPLLHLSTIHQNSITQSIQYKKKTLLLQSPEICYFLVVCGQGERYKSAIKGLSYLGKFFLTRLQSEWVFVDVYLNRFLTELSLWVIQVFRSHEANWETLLPELKVNITKQPFFKFNIWQIGLVACEGLTDTQWNAMNGN